MSRVIALLTDFGTRDWYVGAMKGVLLSRCPSAQLVDLTHDIPPQDVVAGAFTLAAAVPWFPRGTVFLAVVDPGVGSARGLLAAQADGRYFVGPDNGLLALSLQAARSRRVVRLTRAEHWLPAVSRTFHGRDILSPVAARLAREGSLERLGTPTARWASLAVPSARRAGAAVEGAVIHVDAFGNLITNIPERLLGRGSATVVLHARPRARRARLLPTYSAGRSGEVVAVIGSLGWLEVAQRNGSAARACRVGRGTRVTVQPTVRRHR